MISAYRIMIAEEVIGLAIYCSKSVDHDEIKMNRSRIGPIMLVGGLAFTELKLFFF